MKKRIGAMLLLVVAVIAIGGSIVFAATPDPDELRAQIAALEQQLASLRSQLFAVKGEVVYDSTSNVHVRTLDVRVVEMNNYLEHPGQAFRMTYEITNLLPTGQEVIYYFDAPLSMPPAQTTIDYHDEKAGAPKLYELGQKVFLPANGIHTLYISLTPGPSFPSPTQSADFSVRFKVTRWLGPRG